LTVGAFNATTFRRELAIAMQIPGGDVRIISTSDAADGQPRNVTARFATTAQAGVALGLPASVRQQLGIQGAYAVPATAAPGTTGAPASADSDERRKRERIYLAVGLVGGGMLLLIVVALVASRVMRSRRPDMIHFDDFMARGHSSVVQMSQPLQAQDGRGAHHDDAATDDVVPQRDDHHTAAL
jgi:hypothetical protein